MRRKLSDNYPIAMNLLFPLGSYIFTVGLSKTSATNRKIP